MVTKITILFSTVKQSTCLRDTKVIIFNITRDFLLFSFLGYQIEKEPYYLVMNNVANK
jgi:hypothetical protein